MRLRRRSTGGEDGFTIVELIVVIVVIGILAGISILGYGGWRSTTISNQVKSDLNAVAAAMENYRTFNNGYPTSLPSTVQPSGNDTLKLSADSTTSNYCVDGVSSDNPSGTYYVASETKSQGALSGTCATRTGQTLPGVPTGLATVTVNSTSVVLTWSTGSGPAPVSYTAQCASDTAFILNSGQTVVSSTTGTVAGLAANSTQYCRVKATNAAGDSAWSSTITVISNGYVPPSGFVVASTASTSITLSWTASEDAVTYTLQCASNSTFTAGLMGFNVSPPTTTGQFNGLSIGATYYCRINLTNAFATSAWSSTVSGTTSNQYGSLAVGSSIEGYWSSAPSGYLAEDGSAVSRTTYSDLFAVIGTTYGAGDGSTTFNLPDSRARVTVNLSPSDAEFNTMGEKYGAKTDVQSVAQLPSHNHTQNLHSHTLPVHASGTEASGYGMVGSGSFTNRVYVQGSAGSTLSTTTATNQYTGGSVAHNIIQPSIVKTYAIKYALPDGAASTLPAGSSIHGYWTSAPTNYLLENGSAVSRTTYATLFAAIGTMYGAGDGSTTFNLPDSRGRVSVNISPSDAEFNTMGEKYGEKTHTMTVNEMPSHTHIQDPHNHAIGFYWSSSEASPYGINAGGGFVDRVIVGNSSFPTTNVTATNQSTGSGAAENVIQPSIVQTSAIKYTAATTGSSPEVSIGTSVPVYVPSVPTGYLAENGAAVSRSTYANLFAVIGTTYGTGDGSTTFNLPDSRGRVGVNLATSEAEFNTMGEKYGEKTHLMTIAEMASHTHIQDPHSDTVALYPSGAEAAGYGAASPGQGFGGRIIVTGGGTATSSDAATNQSTGGGQAFNVIQPSIVKLFVIKY